MHNTNTTAALQALNAAHFGNAIPFYKALTMA
jgi:hypothetical protein